MPLSFEFTNCRKILDASGQVKGVYVGVTATQTNAQGQVTGKAVVSDVYKGDPGDNVRATILQFCKQRDFKTRIQKKLVPIVRASAVSGTKTLEGETFTQAQI